MRVIAVTGGIGSGKSVVCRVLSAMGYDVYDCDSEARRIMDSDEGMKRRIADEITPEALDRDGNLDRKAIAGVVFADASRLAALNAIVHGAVRDDIARRLRVAADAGVALYFIETAILYESGLDRMVGEVWEVTAPQEVRIRRAMLRDGAGYESIKARVDAQTSAGGPHSCVHVIVNDGREAVLPQIHTLL